MTPDESRAERADRIRASLYAKESFPAQHAGPNLPRTTEVMSLGSDIAWGELWSREGLDMRARSISSLSVVVAAGRMEQVRFHINVALTNGLTAEEIVELIFHIGFYAGFPANAAAQQVATEVFAERGILDPETKD